MTGNESSDEGSMLLSSLTVASSRSGGFAVLRVRMFLAFRASASVARSEAALASRSLRAFSTDSMYFVRVSILVFRALRGALAGSRDSPLLQAQAASSSLFSSKPAVADL